MRWRTVDIVVASVLGVAFGVIFWAWYLLWEVAEPAFTGFPPLRALLYGVWLLPAVLGGLIIRKPGAAFYCELLAAIVSALLGNSWGATVVAQGAVEGLAGELAFLIFWYRYAGLPVAVLSGVLAGLGATLFDAFVWYVGTSWTTFRLPFVGFGTLSALVIAGLGGWALTRALATTGVLDQFPAGRGRKRI